MDQPSAVSRRHFLASAAAAPLAAAQPEPAEAGFSPLFDGRSLEGWQIVDGPESSFHVQEGALCVSPFASFPAWLRSAREYENFDFRGEFYIRGWTDSGLYLHAPLYGRPTHCGLQVKIFHAADKSPAPWSCGSIFPLVAPSNVTVRREWNDFRVLCDWPSLKVWINGEIVQDLDMHAHPELRHRLRRGFMGIAAASAACRFRRLRIRELPSKERWTILYEKPEDLAANWFVSEGKPDFTAHGAVLRSDALGHLATKNKFRDFELHCYARGCPQHNGGILFRSSGRGGPNPRHYEIQLHNVEEAHFPTGSLYNHMRAVYPRIEDGKWFLIQLLARGSECMVRINGETVMRYDRLELLEEWHVELQAHRRGYWLEFQRLRIKDAEALS